MGISERILVTGAGSSNCEPLNLGTDRLVSINELVDLVAAIARKKIRKTYDLTKPQGVRGRDSDNTWLCEVLKWEPLTSLEDGLARTYAWITAQVRQPALSTATLQV